MLVIALTSSCALAFAAAAGRSKRGIDPLVVLSSLVLFLIARSLNDIAADSK